MGWSNKLIQAVGRAYQKQIGNGFSEESELQHGEFWLEVNKKDGIFNSIKTDSGLTVGEISEILSGMHQAKINKQALYNAENNLREYLELYFQAKKIMKQPEIPYNKRRSMVLKLLGLAGCEHNKGGETVNHNKMKCDYDALRRGSGFFINGKLEKHSPKSHDDAVQTIEEIHHIEWDALERACNEKGINLTKNSENFCIKK